MKIYKNLALAIGSIAALGLFVTIGPIAVIGVTVLVLLFILAMEQPKMAFYAAIAIHLVVPLYVTTPPIGFLPMLPVSIWPLVGISTICLLANLLKPESAKMGSYGRVLMAALYLLVIFSLASLTDEMSSHESFETWIRDLVIPLFICWMSIRLLHTVDDIQKLFYVLMFAGACDTFYAVSEYLMGHNILIDKLIMTTDSPMRDDIGSGNFTAEELSQLGFFYRCKSVFTNPLEFGTFMNMVFPFPLVAAVLACGKRRWFYGFIAAVCLLGVLLTFSRGPILSSVLQVLGLAWLLRPLRRVVIGSALAMVLAVTLAWPMIGDSITNRLQDKDNVTMRLKFWETGLHLFADNPVLGIGLANYPSYNFKTERDYRVGPFLIYAGDVDLVRSVENAYIQLAAETGLLGFGSFMSAIVVFYALTIKLYRLSLQNSDALLQALALGSGFGAFGYFFNGLTYTIYNFFVVTPALFLFFSIVIVLERSLNSTGLTSRLQRCA